MKWDAKWPVDSFKDADVSGDDDGDDNDDGDGDNLLSLRVKSQEELVSTHSLTLASKQLKVSSWL